MLYSRSLLVIYFIYSGVYVSLPVSQCIPPLCPYPLGTIHHRLLTLEAPVTVGSACLTCLLGGEGREGGRKGEGSDCPRSLTLSSLSQSQVALAYFFLKPSAACASVSARAFLSPQSLLLSCEAVSVEPHPSSRSRVTDRRPMDLSQPTCLLFGLAQGVLKFHISRHVQIF